MAGRRAASFLNNESVEIAAGVPQDIAKAEFGRRLYRFIVARGWSQSEFARQTKAHTPDGASGVTRDLVSKYVGGRVLPSPVNFKILVDTLGVGREELLPVGVSPEAADALPRMALREIGDDKVWLSVNQVVDFETGLKILALLREGKG